MIISGIVMATDPDELGTLSARVDEIPWADTHFSDEKGRLIVTMEAADVEESMQRLNVLKALPRVIMAELSQYFIEDDESTAERPDASQPIRTTDRPS